MVTLLSMTALVVASLLGWNLYQRFGADRIAALNERRRPMSRLVSRGQYVDGSRTVPVALAVTRSTFFYENADLQGSLDLKWLREVEYASELATGARMSSGSVLRLRAHSQTFEFVIPEDAVSRWQTTLPSSGPGSKDGVSRGGSYMQVAT